MEKHKAGRPMEIVCPICGSNRIVKMKTKLDSRYYSAGKCYDCGTKFTKAKEQ